VRERLFSTLRLSNPAFPGTPTDLLRLTQKLLDRFIFAFFYEDMGERMLFSPQLIRDQLTRDSTDITFDPSGEEIWGWFKRLFAHMNRGGRFGELFAQSPLIDQLSMPNDVFVAPGQGANSAALARNRDTLLHLCAAYNYAGRADARESLSLYSLGRIFEQSISELEFRVGELENRDTVARLSKRKRDGVYYTPEWLVNLLVEQTLGPWFADAKRSLGWTGADERAPSLAAAEAYVQRLKAIRIVDPACGAGAFLISAFGRLLKERLDAARDVEAASGGGVVGAPDEAGVIADILTHNLYGVDINPASVEITKLALWLHSVRVDSPLSALDRTIRCGNSLVGHDVWRGREATQDLREQVNSFDWREAFPELWPDGRPGGFDIVLGNPPYVKLQTLMKVDPEVAVYLQSSRGEDTYASAQTGNFDLYLPFIEKGLRLLAPGGRMAYIAPSLWVVNEYGRSLRAAVNRGRQLDRWIDFKAHQVFDEAITYTALQFYTREPNDAVRMALAPRGETDIDWSDPDLAVGYDDLPPDAKWLIATGPERRLIERLARTCRPLKDRRITNAIVVGLQTSADAVFHLKRIANGHYECAPPRAPSYVVEIEDEIMKPLISGVEAKRYEAPETETYILFPYERGEDGAVRLLRQNELERRFPNAWAYLLTYETVLRSREQKKDRNGEIVSAPFDTEDWYRFGRNQSLERQDAVKLIVPRIVEHLKASLDDGGRLCLDNVDVGGVIPRSPEDAGYLLAVINGPVADFVFRRIAKPFQGDYRSANKQFIAPLPVPEASEDERSEIGIRARDRQRSGARRRDLLRAAAERLGVLAKARHGPRWLWPHLPDFADVVGWAPKARKLAGERRTWAEQHLDEFETAEREQLQAALDAGVRLAPSFQHGELRLYAGGAPVIGRIYLDAATGALTEAYWRYLLLSQTWREADSFSRLLRRPPTEANPSAARQFIERVNDLQAETDRIEAAEADMNARLYALYGLTDEERDLVDSEWRASVAS